MNFLGFRNLKHLLLISLFLGHFSCAALKPKTRPSVQYHPSEAITLDPIEPKTKGEPTTNSRPKPSSEQPISTVPEPGIEDDRKNKNAAIAGFARKFVGSTYKYGGKDPKGFDCSGFTHFVMKQFDIQISPNSGMQSQEGRSVKLKDVQPGDLVFFEKGNPPRVFHVSLVLENTEEGIIVVHSTTSRGVIVENISRSTYWSPMLASARRVTTP